MKRSVLIGCVGLLMCAGVAAAPEARPAGELLRAWSDRFGASVQAEPALEGLPVAAVTSSSLERSLDGLKRAAPALRWARWEGRGEVEAAEVGRLGRAQSRITAACMAVGRPESPALRVLEEVKKPGALAGYAVFAAEEEAGRQAGERLADLQRQQTALAGEGDAAAAYGGMMSLLAQMPPEEARKFAGATVAAADRVWDATSPDQRQALMTDARTLITGALQKRDNDAPAARQPAPSGGYPADLLAAARALGREEQATILVDPGIFAAARTRLPQRGNGVEERLTALARQHAGVVWRRVYVPERDLARLKKRGATAAWIQEVRSLDALETEPLDLEDPESGRRVRFELRKPRAGKDPAESLPGDMRKLYLVLSATPSARGRTREERLLDLQRQQVDLMLRMSPEQMAAAMGPLVAAYGAAGPEERRRLIGLPLTAGMMAGWMPRHAKESAQ